MKAYEIGITGCWDDCFDGQEVTCTKFVECEPDALESELCWIENEFEEKGMRFATVEVIDEYELD